MKILCITWHYPPSGEIAGKVVYRLVRALESRGHRFVILTVPASAAVRLDPGFGADLPGVRIERVKPWPDLFETLGRVERRLLRRTGNGSGGVATVPRDPRAQRRLAVVRNYPDRVNLWIPPARRALRRLIREERPDILLSSAPYHSAHLAALGAHRAFPDLPWWAWSHDPVTRNPYEGARPGLIERRLARLEATVVGAAHGNIVTTVELADEYERRFGRRPIVLYSGYDPDDVAPSVGPPPAGPMVITHAGTLYGSRTPVPLFEAIAGLIRHGALAADELRVRLIGDATDLVGESPGDAIARLGLQQVASVEPPTTQKKAFDALRASHVGLVFAEGQKLQVPAKIFDCMGLGRPVLAIADGATAALVERHQIGAVATSRTLPADLIRLVEAFRRDRLRAATDRVMQVGSEFAITRQADVFEAAAATGTA